MGEEFRLKEKRAELEGRGAHRAVRAAARCPRCGADDHLRLEYRCDVLGISAADDPVLTADGELTDIFCLACGEEVDDILGPDGPVLARERSGAARATRSGDAGGRSPLEERS